jgi:acyl-coenzyme A synthetase/AMP-(fatty) acid ligase
LPARGGALSTVRWLLVAGAAMPPDLFAAARERVTPNLASGYGITEIGIMALADRELLARAPASGGRLLADVEAEVVDAAGERLPRGARGILRFRREHMAREYFRNPQATAKAFRDGWFYPGDLGRIDAEGLVFVEGRLDDELNIGGVKIEPAPIEQALQAHASVVEAAVFAAAPDQAGAALFAAAVVRAPVDEKALIAHCRSRVGPMHTPVRIFFTDKLPRNEAGKLLRAELARRVGRREAK